MGSITSRELNEEGENRFTSDDLEGARTCFELALKISPDDPLAGNNLGVALWRSGKPGEALLELSRVLSTNPDYRPAVVNASEILASNGQADQARELLNSFLEEYPEDHELQGVLRSLGDANVADGTSVLQPQPAGSLNCRSNSATSTDAFVESRDSASLSSGKPLVSIIVPTKDRPDLLRDTLESLNAQSYKNWEAVVVNDGGEDVEALIRNLDHGDRIRHVRHESSRGLPSARNTGIQHSNGEILCYLDDDDMFMPHHLETVVEAICENQASFVYTEAEYAEERVEDGRRRVVARRHPYSGIEYSRDKLHVGNYIPVNTWAHRRELLQHSGLFDPELNALEDWDLLIRFSRLVEFVRIPQITVEVRVRVSSGQDHMSQRERKDFPALYRKIYARYNLNDEAWLRLRECQLEALDKEHGNHRRDDEPVESGSDHLQESGLDRCAATDSCTADKSEQSGLEEELVGTDPVASDEGQDPQTAYRKWLGIHSLQERDIEGYTRRMMNGWTFQPSVHLLMTHVPGQEEALADTLDTLGAQLYGGWGLSIVSNSPCPDPVFEEMEMLEWCQVEGDLIQGINGVVEMSGAEWLALLEAGILLEPHMLYQHVEHLHQHPEWRLVYMDEDRVDDRGERYDPLFKPDFNLELLRSTPYLGNLLLVRREILTTTGGYSLEPGTVSYETAFRVVEQFGAGTIGHISDVLVHHQDQFRLAVDEQVIAENRRVSVAAHLERSGIDADVQHGPLLGSYFVDYACRQKPVVDIIVAVSGETAILDLFLNSLRSQTAYPNYRVHLMFREGMEVPECLCDDGDIRLHTFSGADVLWGVVLDIVQDSDAEYLLLMSPGCIAIQNNWLDRLVAQANNNEAAVVAPRLISSDKKILGSGLILGGSTSGIGAGAYDGLSIDDSGYMGRAQVAQELSAVPSNCMLVRKSVYEKVGGLSSALRIPLYQSIEFCLRVRALGERIIWTPHSSVLYRGDDASALSDIDIEATVSKESEMLCDRSLSVLANDPAYNPNLRLVGEKFTVDTDLVPAWSRSDHSLKRIVGFGSGSLGSWKFRVEQPLEAIHQERLANSRVLSFSATAVRLPTATELERIKPDVLLMHNTIYEGYMDAIERYKKLNDVFIAFGQDDLIFELPAKNPFSKTIYKDAKKRLRRCLALADRLIVSTVPLAEALAGMADDIKVVPNRLDEAIWDGLVSQRGVSEKPRVGWAGALQHGGDLELLEEVVRQTAEEVDWVFFGMCSHALRPYVKEAHDPIEFALYPGKLASLNLDLAVAPLEHNRFNECKSNLRLLEYGVLGWPVVASDIAPYRDAPVCRVANQPRAWVNAVRERIHDLDAARREGDELRNWVRDNWMLQQHLDEWLAALAPDCDVEKKYKARNTATG